MWLSLLNTLLLNFTVSLNVSTAPPSVVNVIGNFEESTIEIADLLSTIFGNLC